MALSLVLFALGVGLISFLLVLNKQLKENFDKNLAGIDLVVGAKGSPLQLILCSMYHIDSPTGNISIKEVKPFLNPKHPWIESAVPLSLGDSHKGYRIVGTTHGLLEYYASEIGEGKLWQKNMEVTLGAVVSNELGVKIGDTFKSSHGFVLDENLVHEDAHSLKVVGILKPTGSVIDQLILTNTQSVWAVHDHVSVGSPSPVDSQQSAVRSPQSAVNSRQSAVGSQMRDDDHAVEVAHEDNHSHILDSELPRSLLEEDETKEITSVLIKFKGRNYQALNMGRSINENSDMQAANPAIELNRLHSIMDVGTEALQALAFIIIFVSGLSIFISLFSSLKERKYELALMRVMGASPGKLFTLIVLEGLLLAAIGYALGIGLSHGGMDALAGYMKESYRYSFSGMEFLKEEIYLLAGALGIGFLAAVIPAVQARNTDISETLAKA